MTAVAVFLLIAGGLLIISGIEHVSIVATVQQILSGQYNVQRQP